MQAQFPAIQVVHNQPVVVAKRRITANGGLVSYRAALVLLGQMTSAQHAQEVHKKLGLERLGEWEDVEVMIGKADEEATD